MAREKKAQIIEQVEESFKKSKIGILTDYRGLTAADMNGLRRKVKESGMQLRVVKNTLARQAAEKLGRNEVASLFSGPVAVVSSQGDEAQAARVLDEYIRNNRLNLTIKGGFLGAKPITAKDVTTLSTLPSREILISRVVGGMQSPIAGLVNVLAAPIRGVAGVLQARIKQMEGS